jgi:NADPH-dependent ferric siderophore reductase
MRLGVVSNDQLTPHMQRLVLTAPELGSFSYQPGQDVMLMVAVDGNRPVRRRYTIRDLDPARQRLTMDIVRHGDGPGESWVRAARPGDTIEGIGPRGKIFPAQDADWHLFAADESGLAAVFAMISSLPAGTRAIALLEIPEPADEQPLDAKAHVDLRWLPRTAGDGDGPVRPAGDPERLAAALTGVQLPDGHGHAYLFGEARVVLALREMLASRGLAADQVSPKAYWGRGKANASHGEPARDS